jgi:hypothetical protein
VRGGEDVFRVGRKLHVLACGSNQFFSFIWRIRMHQEISRTRWHCALPRGS